MKKFIQEFKAFINKGNVLGLAVGVIIGGAFSTITTSLTNDIIMPIVSIFLGGMDFSTMRVTLPTFFSLEENAAFYFLMGGGDLVSATLETMSEEMGMSRRSLCYILRRWRQAGLLEPKGRGYRIRDRQALERMTEGIRHFCIKKTTR